MNQAAALFIERRLIKQCRRIATRYDKLAANYLAFVKLAAIRIWLRAYEFTPYFFFLFGLKRMSLVSKWRPLSGLSVFDTRR